MGRAGLLRAAGLVAIAAVAKQTLPQRFGRQRNVPGLVFPAVYPQNNPPTAIGCGAGMACAPPMAFLSL